jgi:uncharacterized protein (TIGR02453 family)
MFSPKTISFLRNLKRNNDREWFRGHKVEYEQHVRTPIVALLARLDEDFQTFAPELIAHPSVSLFRIYRDTRFSANKSPLKTQIGAYFPHRVMRKRGAGLYIEVGPDRVYIGGGLYVPNTADLQAIREHVASHHTRLRRIVNSAGFRRAVGELQGNQLQRVPRGFPKDHPAADYLRFRQFLAGTERPAAFAYNPGFYRELLAVFRQVAPLIQFLNQPLTST